jgi:hypothetical protein
MKGMFSMVSLLALATLLAAAGAAPAEMTHWSYSAVTDPQDVPGEHGGGFGGPFFGMHFFYQRSDSQTNSAHILLLQMQPFSNGPGVGNNNRVLAFPFRDAPFTLNLGLRDTASGALGNLLFPGLLNGLVSNGPDNNVRLSFTGPTIQDVVLGQNRYTVHLGSYVPPGPLDSGQLGSLSAQVDVSPAGSPAATPEPSCLVLAGMGLVTVAGAAWRKRRRNIRATSVTELMA